MDGTEENYSDSTSKKRFIEALAIRTLNVKLSGCSKFFYRECVWANQQNHGTYVIKRAYHQPNSPIAFAVFCRCEGKEQQIGWIKELDKAKFLDFIYNCELEDLSIRCCHMKIRPEHKAAEGELKISC